MADNEILPSGECSTDDSPDLRRSTFRGFGTGASNPVEVLPTTGSALQAANTPSVHPFKPYISQTRAHVPRDPSQDGGDCSPLESNQTQQIIHTSSVHGLKRLRSTSSFANPENGTADQSPTKRLSAKGLELPGLKTEGLRSGVSEGQHSEVHGLEIEVSSPGSWVTETGFEGLEAFDDATPTSPQSLGGFEGFGTGLTVFGGDFNFKLDSPGNDLEPENSSLSCEFKLEGLGLAGEQRDPSEVESRNRNGCDLADKVCELSAVPILGDFLVGVSEESGFEGGDLDRENLDLPGANRRLRGVEGDDVIVTTADVIDDVASGDFASALEADLSECSESVQSFDSQTETPVGGLAGGLAGLAPHVHFEGSPVPGFGGLSDAGFEGLTELDAVTGGDAVTVDRVARIEALLEQEIVREAELIEARIALEGGGTGFEANPRRVDITTWLQGLRRGGLEGGLADTGLGEETEFSEVGSSIGNTSMAVFRGDLNSHLGSVLSEDDEGLDALETRLVSGLEGPDSRLTVGSEGFENRFTGRLDRRALGTTQGLEGVRTGGLGIRVTGGLEERESEGEGMGPTVEHVGGLNHVGFEGQDLVGFELAPNAEEQGVRAGVWGEVRTGLGGVRLGLDGVRLRRRTREEEELPLLAQLSPRSEGGVDSALDSYPHLYYMDPSEEHTASEQIEHILTGHWNTRQGLGVLEDDVMDDVAEMTLTEVEWVTFLHEALIGAWRRERQGLEEGLESGSGNRLSFGSSQTPALGGETLRRFNLLNPVEMVAALADPRLVAHLETRTENGQLSIVRGFGGLEDDDVMLSDDDDNESSPSDASEVTLDDVSHMGDDVTDSLDSYGAFCVASGKGGLAGQSEDPPGTLIAEEGGGSGRQSDPPLDCSICYRPLEAEPVLALKCGHEYHGTCVKKWLKSGAPNALSCPFCRGKIRRTPALEELLPANGSVPRLRRTASEATIDLHDERGLDRGDLLHEVRQWPDAERLIVSGVGVETVLQVLEEAQAEIRVVELYGTGEDRVPEEERFWYRLRGDALPPLPTEPALITARGSAAVQRLLLHNGEMRSGPIGNPIGLTNNALGLADNPVGLAGSPGEPGAVFTGFLRRVFEQLPNLVDFSAPACGPEVRPAGLAWMARCCPKLRILRLGWCSFPELGLGVQSLAEALGQQLEELEILGPFLNFDSLNALVLNCRRLRVLNITRGHHGGNWPHGNSMEENGGSVTDVDEDHADDYDEAFERLAQLNPLLRIEVNHGNQDYVSF